MTKRKNFDDIYREPLEIDPLEGISNMEFLVLSGCNSDESITSRFQLDQKEKTNKNYNEQ